LVDRPLHVGIITLDVALAPALDGANREVRGEKLVQSPNANAMPIPTTRAITEAKTERADDAPRPSTLTE